MPTKKQMIEALKGNCGGTCLVDPRNCECFKSFSQEEKNKHLEDYGFEIEEIRSKNNCFHYLEAKRHVDGEFNIPKFLNYCINKMIKEGSLHKKDKKDKKTSTGWTSLRYKAFRKYGKKCSLCGRSSEDGLIMHVDHIKPQSKYPELSRDINNLQILCSECNIAKSNKYEDNWREYNDLVKREYV